MALSEPYLKSNHKEKNIMAVSAQNAPYALTSVAQIRAQQIAQENQTGKAAQELIEISGRVNRLIGVISSTNFAAPVPLFQARQILKELKAVGMPPANFRLIPQIRAGYQQECLRLLLALKGKVTIDLLTQQGVAFGLNDFPELLPTDRVISTINRSLTHRETGKHGPANF